MYLWIYIYIWGDNYAYGKILTSPCNITYSRYYQYEISTIAMQIPRVAYASTDEASSFSSSSDDEDCGSDELPASEYRPNNKRCMDPGECYPSEFELEREIEILQLYDQ